MASAPKKLRGCSNKSLWSKELTHLLISLFEASEDLWNISSPLYCDRNHKLKLQTEIALKLEMPVEEIAAKLHNLRCQYNGENRKLKAKKSGAGTNDLYTSHWEYFEALKFLSGAGQSGSSTSNLQIQDENAKTIEINSDGLGVGSYRKKTIVSKDNLKKNPLLTKAEQILGAPPDSHQIFGDFIADHCRNLPEHKQKRLKLLIHKAIVAVEEEPEPSPIPDCTQQFEEYIEDICDQKYI